MTKVTPYLFEERPLLRELNHRINNEFAALINTISLAAARSPHREVKVALNEATEALHAYAAVHRALRMPTPGAQVDAAGYLRELCDSMSRSKLEHLEIALVLVCSPVTLASERCWHLGMIVYELVTNAARHAFGGGVGKVRVELSCADGDVRCVVTDNGSASPAVGRGQGLEIVSHLADDLGGTVQHRFQANGSTSILVLPLVTPGPRPGGRIGDVIAKASAYSPCRVSQLLTGTPGALGSIASRTLDLPPSVGG
jgi:two-component sensor histidine kinase